MEQFENSLMVSIQDSKGTLVQQNNGTSVDVSNLENGLYFIQIATEIGTTTKQFIKQ